MTIDASDDPLGLPTSTPGAHTYPFSNIEDLAQSHLWLLLFRHQQRDTLSIADRTARHESFAAGLAANGYTLGQSERVHLQDLVAAIANYLATLDDAEKLRDAGGCTRREVALSELMAFMRWTLESGAGQRGLKP